MLYIVLSILTIVGGYKFVLSISRIYRFIDELNIIQQDNIFHNAKEVPEPVWIPIQGVIPQWLSGVMYRVGK